MPGLLDIAQSTKTVLVGDKPIPVYGVSAKGIASLLERFPDFRKLFVGQSIDFSPETIVQIVPNAIAAIIAAGIGFPGDADQEREAERLPAGIQADLLHAILAATMPTGAGPFAEKLAALAATVSGKSMNIPDMKSPPQSNS